MKRIKVKNVNHPGYSENRNAEKYTIIKDAVLESLATLDSDGSMSFSELETKVAAIVKEKDVPAEMFPKPGSIRWYTKTVQLDLEARDEIERVPEQSPIRLRLMTK